MDSNTENSLDALIRTGSLRTPPSDLTDKIMYRIDLEVAKTSDLEPALKKLIRLHTLKTPSSYLVQKIEMEVFPKNQKYPPLISARVGYAVSLCLAVLLASGYYFSAETGPHGYKISYWTSALYKLPYLLLSIPEEYLAGLVALFTLLAMDFLLRYKIVQKLAKS